MSLTVSTNSTQNQNTPHLKFITKARENFVSTFRRYEAQGYNANAEYGRIWRDNCEKILRPLILQCNDIGEIFRQITSRAFFDTTCKMPFLEFAAQWYDDMLLTDYGIDLKGLPPGLAESKLLPEERRTIQQGRQVSSDFLHRLGMLASMETQVQVGQIDRIVEIGGGYGALARVIMLAYPKIKYCIVDIPETLFFAEIFLASEFPDKKLVHVDDRTSKALIEDADILLVPTGFVGMVSTLTFDLAINTNSLGEMPVEISKKWINWLEQNDNVKAVFSLNRFLNVVDGHAAEYRRGAVGCNFHWGKNWQVLSWEVNPPFERCPYGFAIITRNLCLMMIKTQQADEIPLAQLRDAIRKYSSQDWFTGPYWHNYELRLGALSAPPMSKLAPDLNPDLKQSGMLFDLWNIRRLCGPNLVDDLMRAYWAYLASGGKTRVPSAVQDMFFEEELFWHTAAPKP